MAHLKSPPAGIKQPNQKQKLHSLGRTICSLLNCGSIIENETDIMQMNNCAVQSRNSRIEHQSYVERSCYRQAASLFKARSARMSTDLKLAL